MSEIHNPTHAAFIDYCLEQIAEGRSAEASPYMNCVLAAERGREALREWEKNGAPWEVLMTLKRFMDQAEAMIKAVTP